MARLGRPTRRSLRAAVTPLDIGHELAVSRRRVTSVAEQAWQQRAWKFYNEVGELRFVCQWLSNSASRVRLYAADVDPTTGRPEDKPSSNVLASQLVNDIAGGPAGQSELMSRAATALTVPGEMHIAILNLEGDDESWHIIPSRNVRRDVGADVVLTLDDGTEHRVDPRRESVFRVHTPHPENPQNADSPVRAALPILSEIRSMDALISAAARSRVAGNGLFLVPKEVQSTRAVAPAGGDAPGLPSAAIPGVQQESMSTQLSRTLSSVMKEALEDPGSPEALTPIVLAVPQESIQAFRHITFDSDVTAQHKETREAAIRRLALSLDVPAEVLLGLGDSTHWNAGLVDEQAVRQHIAPLVTTICDALTVSVLRPLLEAAGQDPSGVVVWFDLSPLTKKNDRGEDARSAFDAGAISVEALRRELGFDDADAPVSTQQELARQIVLRAPSLWPQLAKYLGFDDPTEGEVAESNAIIEEENRRPPVLPEEE